MLGLKMKLSVNVCGGGSGGGGGLFVKLCKVGVFYGYFYG